jgi:hypothetical protein
MKSEFTATYSAIYGSLATSTKLFKTTQALKIKNPTLVLDFCLLTIYSLTKPT